MASQPAIIEVAINGATTKERNPNVPRTPDEIAADALACLAAGAAIIHNHIDLTGISEDEAAERYLEAWRVVLAERPDALWYPTVHFGTTMSLEHLTPIAASGLLRLGLTDPGSVNLGRLDDQGVPFGGLVYANSFDDIGRAFALCRDLQLGPSLAIYEPGFLRATLAYWRAGLLPEGAMVKLYFSAEQGPLGASFGLPPTAKALDAYLELLEGCDLPWAVSAHGGDVVATRGCAACTCTRRTSSHWPRVLRWRPHTDQRRTRRRGGRACARRRRDRSPPPTKQRRSCAFRARAPSRGIGTSPGRPHDPGGRTIRAPYLLCPLRR